MDPLDICSTTLGPCHQGAAIAGLCPTGSKLPDPSPPFYHNVSSASNQKPGAANADGILSYILHASGIDVPSAMSMDAGLSSNVVNPTFYPNVEPYTLLAFDENGCAYISAGQDDTVSPPTYYDPSRKLNNWYICLTRWSYLYYTLSWKIGVTGEPQNPSCQKVDVMRIFN